MDLDKMLFTIPSKMHSKEKITEILKKHPEVKFVSLVGVDLGGHDTDEKIPVQYFIDDMDNFFQQGVQTDGSSVILPKIAELNNAKVDIIPDTSVDWFVDYNFKYIDEKTGLPVGTLRIPSFLLHNDTAEVGSRVVLRDADNAFSQGVFQLLEEHPYALEYMGISSINEIERVVMTGATELEFWVKTPEDRADRQQLSTSQELKEQYWQRTRGSVRTALEKSLVFLDRYGFCMEMGHKEVGGIKAKLGSSGEYDHIMEQLEIDWKFSTLLQASDNDLHIRYVVKDIFRLHGLEVSFMAKPIEGVVGSGKHTHIGAAVELKDGRTVNLFAPQDMKKYFMTPVGFGALLGMLKNYEIINPFISSSNDALARLKPGFEAPVCIVTSLGHSTENPSRNRTVLLGLIRDEKNPLATRFELRSPNPKSNTYLVMATAFLAMLDGIKAALKAEKTPEELEASLSKAPEDSDFYLEKGRAYRSEEDVYKAFTQEERDRVFGKAPNTVWESIRALDLYPEKRKVLIESGVFSDLTIESYKEAVLAQWAMELSHRIIPNNMDLVRECRKLHTEGECTDYDLLNWSKIQELRKYLGQDRVQSKSLLTRIKMALEDGNYQLASDLQIEMSEKIQELTEIYIEYRKNLF